MSNHLNDPALRQAMTLQQSGDAAGAAAIYRRLMQSGPANAQILFLLGAAEMQMGNFEEAVSLLRKSLRMAPNQFRALSNLGVAQKELGRHEEALVSLDRAIAVNPDYAMAHNNRGAVLLQLGRQDEALASFERAIAIEPRYTDAHSNRGNILRERGKLEEALAAIERSLALDADNPAAHCSRGIILNELCRPKQALASFDRAIALDSQMANAHCGRATALFSLKQIEDARQSNARALAVEPDHAEARWNSARFALIMGDFAAGWELQEERWKLHEVQGHIPWFMSADSGRTLWSGEEDIVGKTLLVHTEQGFGDVVQFCRYLPMLRGAKVVVQAKARLLPLLRTLEGEYDFIDTPPPNFDFYCPIMSLPRAFATRLDTIPADVPYLFAEAEKQERVLARLGEKTAPRIGLVWSGNPGHKTDGIRSIPLERLAPLLQRPFEFHCLQKEISPGDRVLMEAAHVRPHDSEQDDFGDAAALIAAMDLVITVDTAIAHVAGAMGKPVWILLAFMADWRWLLDRQDSPWYPTVTLFRQSAPGDWQSVITAVSERLDRSDFSLLNARGLQD